MPTIAELLKAEGIELPEGFENKLPTLLEASDEVRGLVSTKQELHDWKKANADKVSGFEQLQAKAEEELKERERLAIENNDYKAQIEIRDERAKKQEALINLRNEQALSGSRESAELEIASLFNCQNTGKSLAKNFVNVSIADDGTIAKNFVVNGEAFDSFDSFKQSVAKVDWLAAQMKGPESKGATGGGSNKGSNTPTDKDAAFKQRLAESGLL